MPKADETLLAKWMVGYIKAWSSNDANDIGSLFGESAQYFTAPFRAPWRGRQEIVREWLKRKDKPGTWKFDWKRMLTQGRVHIVTAVTEYDAPDLKTSYSNLWVIVLEPNGQCSEFTEWWMEHDNA